MISDYLFTPKDIFRGLYKMMPKNLRQALLWLAIFATGYAMLSYGFRFQGILAAVVAVYALLLPVSSSRLAAYALWAIFLAFIAITAYAVMGASLGSDVSEIAIRWAFLFLAVSLARLGSENVPRQRLMPVEEALTVYKAPRKRGKILKRKLRMDL